MSGTSVDSVDAALLSIGASDFELVSSCSVTYEDSLRDTLLALKKDPVTSLNTIIELDHRVATAFATAANKVRQQSDYTATEITAIGSHGQTVYHLPFGKYPGTLQIGNPSLIASLTGIDVIADFRRADMAAGGQGAPLAPAFHRFALGTNGGIVLNLGGIANITVLNKQTIGFDTGPANSILDECIQRYKHQPYDHNGLWARTGAVDQRLLEVLLQDPYFLAQPPKSTGTEYFNLHWATQHLRGRSIEPHHLQRTLLELTAVTVANDIQKFSERANVYACGGGLHNTFLLERLRHHLPLAAVRPLDEAGVSADACECCTFAWLARQFVSNTPGNIPSVTGAHAPTILGARYPAAR